jgi:hypothetical protein
MREDEINIFYDMVRQNINNERFTNKYLDSLY